MTQPDTKNPTDIVAGDVIAWNKRLAIVVSNSYPADTVPARSLGAKGRFVAENYCEPMVVLLTHQRDDRWVRTHECTYMLLEVSKPVTLYNSVRVQADYRRGRFLTYEERLTQYEEGMAGLAPIGETYG